MNVNDVPAFEYPTTCWLEEIFKKQHALAEKYGPIERKNGFHEKVSLPLHLDDRFAQYLIKDYAWRFTEEITESLECLQAYHHEIWEDKPEVTHFQEELIDALHFLTELTGTLRIAAIDIGDHSMNPEGPSWRLETLLGRQAEPTTVRVIENQAFKTIMDIGIAMNLLKNKPWKVTHMATDEPRFMSQIVNTWHSFFRLLNLAQLDAKGVYNLYTRKNEVNQFRQRSKY